MMRALGDLELEQRRRRRRWRSSSAATSSARSASSRLRADRLTATGERRARVAASARDLARAPRRARSASAARSGRCCSASGMNSSGRQQAALGVLPAHQRLDADDRAGRERRPSAGSGATSSPSLDRAAQLADAAPAARGLWSVALGVVDRDAGCGAPWPRTSRRRRCCSSVVDVVAVRRGRARCRCWRSTSSVDAVDVERLLAAPSRSRSATATRRRRVGDARQQHGELVAAEPGDRVAVAQRRAAAAAPTCCSSRSPSWWPSVSLISLKRSRSISSTASRLAVARPRGERLLDAVVEAARGSAGRSARRAAPGARCRPPGGAAGARRRRRSGTGPRRGAREADRSRSAICACRSRSTRRSACTGGTSRTRRQASSLGPVQRDVDRRAPRLASRSSTSRPRRGPTIDGDGLAANAASSSSAGGNRRPIEALASE